MSDKFNPPPGSYILHCVHDDHACRHAYASPFVAIESACMDLASGRLQEACQITREDAVVFDEGKLRLYIALCENAQNN